MKNTAVPPRKVRVALICTPLAFQSGGTWNHISSWAKYIDYSKFEIGFFCGLLNPRDREKATASFNDYPGFKPFFMDDLYPPERLFTSGFLHLLKGLKRWRPDIIHTIFIHADLLGFLAKMIVPAKAFISSWETATIAPFSSPWMRWLYRKLFPFVHPHIDRFIAISKDSAHKTAEEFTIQPNKIRLIPNGIEMEKFPFRLRRAADVRTKPKIGYIGRFAPEKQIDLLIRAIPKILGTFPDATFEIAGDGPERSNLISLSDQLHARKSIHFHGWIDDLWPILDSLDMLILPSRSEGLGLILIEAMAAGVPCVSTPSGGVSEIIDHGLNGIILSDHDSGLIAQEVIYLLQHPDVIEMFSKNGRIKVGEHFNLVKEIKEIETLYLEFSK